jgi:hypothetical protein
VSSERYGLSFSARCARHANSWKFGEFFVERQHETLGAFSRNIRDSCVNETQLCFS